MRSVATEWDVFAAAALSPEAGAVQRSQMRAAFYAGVWTMLCTFRDIGDPAAPEADGVELMNRLVDECWAFKKAFVAGDV